MSSAASTNNSTGLPTLAPAPSANESASVLVAPADGPAWAKKKASSACSACRKRRSKCADGVPCRACVIHQTECIKDETDDGRRRLAIKKRIEVLENDRHFLGQLSSALRLSGQEDINSLVALFRSNVPREDIRAFLEDVLAGSENIMQLDNFTTRDDSRPESQSPKSPLWRRRYTGSIADVMNPPVEVPAKPWTSVTDDDDLVSHLMSLWFSWAHPWWHWVDREGFIEAMRSGDTTNPMCAPYLVNMMLAASMLFDVMDDSEESSCQNLREQFYAEGKRELDAEGGRVTLTTVQATGVQWTYLAMLGQDKLGLLMLNQQVFMAKDLPKYTARIMREGSVSAASKDILDRSVSNVQWALFCLNAFTLVSSPKAHFIDRPANQVTRCNHLNPYEPTQWYPYPSRNPIVQFHSECHFSAVMSLAVITSNYERCYKDGSKSYTPEKLHQVERSLQDWFNHMPECMRMHEAANPHVLALHALHHWVALTMSKQAASMEAGHPETPIITSTPSSEHAQRWHANAMLAAVSIGNITDKITMRWGVDHIPVMMMQPISLALLTLLRYLDGTYDQRTTAFVSLSIALRGASRRFRVAKGVLELVRSLAEELGVRLPAETQRLFPSKEREHRVPEQQTKATGTSLDEESLSDIGMEYLLEKWQDIRLE